MCALHFNRLKGRKYLILGNHDVRGGSDVKPHILALDWEQPPTATLATRDECQRVFLSHYAHRTWPVQHNGAIHFYGHSHNTIPHFGMSRDVGCPDVAFQPRTLRELMSILPAGETS
ncbi:hypothetical protein GCM10011385_40420 [Nitratireductor aestuarii]|uniref:Calcineurin-like phosphoesterase domain-containing protein n=1 Tax=Nitratireductor aestuarii TaxID=1735103 RepID=A0A916WAB2_9HYPH|nr:hypothetical protein [Nitratireductor aestuarii]GGA82114.1 hypothetical protein GCM10011385_40420 [Nitratireductor aestuarii]